MYCAPEVLTNFSEAPYDAKAADVWSCGVVLFIMLFGRHPYARDEDKALPAHQQVTVKKLPACVGCHGAAGRCECHVANRGRNTIPGLCRCASAVVTTFCPQPLARSHYGPTAPYLIVAFKVLPRTPMPFVVPYQVVAMFRRLTAPPPSYEGELLIPPVLPTSVLPGAKPGEPLSHAAADLLRGMLARDPRVRITVDGVQQHAWFRSNLPEGAALLNEVVEAEAVEAGEAAIMPAAVAGQLEQLVIAAACGPAAGAVGPAPGIGPWGRDGGGSGGEGGGSGSGGGTHRAATAGSGAARAAGPPGAAGGHHGGHTGSGGAGGHAAATVAPLSGTGSMGGPGSDQQQQQRMGSTDASMCLSPSAAGGPILADSGSVPRHAPPKSTGPAVLRTVTTTASSEAAISSVSIGSTIPTAPPQPGATLSTSNPTVSLPPGTTGAAYAPLPHNTPSAGPPSWPSSASSGAPGQQHGIFNTQQQQTGLHPEQQQQQDIGRGDMLVDPELMQAAIAGTAGGLLNGPVEDIDGMDLLDKLEMLIDGMPEDDLLGAASLDFLSGASALQLGQQTGANGGWAHGQQGEQQQRPASNPSEVAAASAPASTDTAPSAPSAPSSAHRPDPYGDGGGARASSTGAALHANPANNHRTDHKQHRNTQDPGQPPVPQTLSQLLVATSRPAASASPQPPRGPQLFTSLRLAAAAAAADGPEPLGPGLLARLDTDSLPSPHTLAVVDAQPFLLHPDGGRKGSGPKGKSRQGVGINELSVGTRPSTYSMDWCRLSAHSESLLGSGLLSQSLLYGNSGLLAELMAQEGGVVTPEGAEGGVGGGAGGAWGVSGEQEQGREWSSVVGHERGGPAEVALGAAPAGSAAMAYGSAWHKICREARTALSGVASGALGAVERFKGKP